MQTLASRKDIVQVHGFYYSEKENMISVDVVPDISIHDDNAFVSQLINEIQPLVPGMHLEIIVDHNYTGSTPWRRTYTGKMSGICWNVYINSALFLWNQK